MRGRLTLGLTALTLLFLVQGLTALFAVLFGVGYDAVFPRPRPTTLLLALLPIAALLTPALPFSRWIDRPKALALGAVGAAAGRIVLGFPGFVPQYVGATLTVATGALFLAKSVGYLDRRNVAAAAGIALATDLLLRAAGGSWSIALRPEWLPAQLVLSAAAVALTIHWLRDPQMEEAGAEEHALERRAGGLRLRGALALALIFFLELNVLGRAEVAARWTGTSYRVAATALAASGAIAIALMLGAGSPVGRHRPAALALVALTVAGAALTDTDALPGSLRLVLFAAGHAAALLLLGRAVVPATGRRRGWTLAVGLAFLFGLNTVLAFSFFYAFTVPALRGALQPLLIAAGVLLAVILALVPRPLASPPRLSRRLFALPLVLAMAIAAWIATPGDPPAQPTGGDAVRVATYNVHYGYDEGWRYDPERIARTIEASGAHVVALQEVPAGLLVAYGTDLARWLGGRLGMRVLFAPSINGLLGDALLTRLPVLGHETALLPPERADRKVIVRATLALGDGAVTVYATHLGLTAGEQSAQIEAALRGLTPSGATVLMGDLNAEGASGVANALRAAGFRDAFEIAGSPPAPTSPAGRPTTRIDWIWVRGASVSAAEVSADPGSDHRLVAATIQPLPQPGREANRDHR